MEMSELFEAQRLMDPRLEAAALKKLMPVVTRAGRQHEWTPLHERLLMRVGWGMTDCWHWRGAQNKFGYGRMTYEGRLQVAHRLAYRTFVGEIPDGLYVLHKCDNPACINPEHLWLGTYSDNMRDCWAKGRHPGRSKRNG